jgi:hypothetical protein
MFLVDELFPPAVEAQIIAPDKKATQGGKKK